MNSDHKKIRDTEPRQRHVLIVDDHSVVRHGLSLLIGEEEDLSVCGEAATIAEALQAAGESEPDCIVVDISLKGESGLDLIQQLRDRGDKTAVLVLTMHDDSSYAEKALKLGANGYVTKHQADEVLVEAIRRVVAGDLYISEEMSARMLRRYLEGESDTEARPDVDRLSAREREVFELIGRGFSTQKIAEALDLSSRTVDVHRAHIKKKLGYEDAAQIVRAAVRWVDGLTS